MLRGMTLEFLPLMFIWHGFGLYADALRAITVILRMLSTTIEQTAQAILDARALYPDASLADLYDELTMPPELRKAHQANDKAVMAAYGFPVKNFTESDCVAALMKMYQELTAKEGN